MALPRKAYEWSRRHARYHLQVAVVDKELESTEPGLDLWMRCRVHKVFRGGPSMFAGDTACRPGDMLSFSIPVRRGARRPLESSLSYGEYLAAKYFEVFLDGGPAVCFVPLSQWFVIEALSDRPQIALKSGEHLTPGSPSALRRLFTRLVRG